MATAVESYDPYAIRTRHMTHENLLRAATYFNIDPTNLDITALRARVKEVGEARWLEENSDAIEAWIAWEQANDSPLDQYRGF